MLNSREVIEALEDRRFDKYVIDRHSYVATHMEAYRDDVRKVYAIYNNDFSVLWPDGASTSGLPKIANYLALAADDRAREVSGTNPTIMCPPSRSGDKPKAAAEKRERILRGYWANSYVSRIIPQLALNSMLAGFCAVKVWPNMAESDRAKRYPVYSALEPLQCYPDPIFARGPFVDNFLYTYELPLRTIEKRWNVDLSSWMKKGNVNKERGTIIEYYDENQLVIVCQAQNATGYNGERPSEIIDAVNHDLGICPVVVAPRPTGDGVYRSEFIGGLGVTNSLNRLMTMMLDDAYNKVYGVTASYDVENPQDFGPGAHLEYQSEKGKFEWIQPPNQPFTNVQVVRDLTGSVRAANLIPPSRSGDPNESIISAAGVSATQSQFVSDVRDLQRNVISLVLEAANTVALRVDEKWLDTPKPIAPYPEGMTEDYRPSKDIDGNYSNRVTYGQTAGLDPINTNVMALQQFGAQAISKRTMMEQSIFIEDPTREEKRIALEQVDAALQAGLIAQAGQGALDAATLAEIRRQLESDDMTLHEAIANAAPLTPAPLAPPASGSQGGASPQAPGLAGAGEGQSLPQNLPPLAEVLG